MIILNEHIDKSRLDVFLLKYSVLKAKKGSIPVKPSGCINLDIYACGTSTLLSAPCLLTAKNSVFVLCIEHELLFINLTTCNVLTKYSIGNQTNSLKYFLSPTNVFSNSFLDLQPIENSDSLIGLDNLNNLNLIAYHLEANKFRSASNDWLTFESFEIKKNIIVAFDKARNTLVGYNVDQIKSDKAENLVNPFRSQLFKIELMEAELKRFGLSSDCKYLHLIVNEKLLKFYRLDDMNLIGELLLYSSPIQMLCSDDYICMSMIDRRVISFLICDPNDPKAIDKIKSLPSRYKNRFN